MRSLTSLICLLAAAHSSLAKLTWANTKFLFVFGDSYTTDGFNISAGVSSPVPGFTSSNGLNWVQFLGEDYNITDTQVFDLASGGATIDAALVPPFLPTVLSVVDQVSQFKTFLAPKPDGAKWNSSNSLFAIWIGINDFGNSIGWTNITQSEFYPVLMARLTTQIDELYDLGARSFLFLTVPPVDRSANYLSQGPSVAAKAKSFIALYNSDLAKTVKTFQEKHRDLDQVTLFNTQPVFNTLLDNAETFGFVNITGFCPAYANGTPEKTTQILPCAPVSSYFWLNTLHPLWTVHDILAKSISTVISA